MLKTSNPPTMPPPGGYYSQVVEVPPNARWVVLAGQICVRPDGTTPEGFEAQHDQIWQNTIAALESAGMGVDDIVHLNVYSTDPEGRPHVAAQRKKYLGEHKPGSTYLLVAGLAQPEWRVEMDVTAAKVG